MFVCAIRIDRIRCFLIALIEFGVCPVFFFDHNYHYYYQDYYSYSVVAIVVFAVVVMIVAFCCYVLVCLHARV